METIIYSWTKGILFYRIEKNDTITGEVEVVVRVPIWTKDAKWVVIQMTRGLEWGQIFNR